MVCRIICMYLSNLGLINAVVLFNPLSLCNNGLYSLLFNSLKKTHKPMRFYTLKIFLLTLLLFKKLSQGIGYYQYPKLSVYNLITLN